MSAADERAAIVAEVRSLALRAGEAIMGIYESGFTVDRKDDKSPVTDADRAADAVIVSGLQASFPDIPVVTEERPESHRAARNPGRFFLVDPLDGTREFVGRNGEFTVNIALVDNGTPVLGIVYAPAAGRLFYTRADGTAVEEPAARSGGGDAGGRVVKVAAADNAALRVVASRSHRDRTTDDYIARYAVAAFHGAGSSLKFCLIASGEADLYPRLGRTMEWDTAAGHAVLAAAGGRVDCLDGGTLAYAKRNLENPHFVAYAPSVSLITR